VATIAPSDLPGPPASARTSGGRALVLDEPLTTTGGPHGQIVIAGPRSGTAPGGGLLIEGGAHGPFSPISTPADPASSMTLATGYLGDVAVGAVRPGAGGQPVVQVRIERYFAHTFAEPITVNTAGAGSVEALTVALDYRTDALVAWLQGGAIYARDLPASGQVHPTEVLAPAPAPAHAHPNITALISDDNRAIVAWAEESGGETSVYVSISAPGVQFGAARLLERFRDPGGIPPPSGSPRLVRLSNESVMMAWDGAQGGHWVVRAAAVDLTGVRAAHTISPVDSDALLAGLAPGPADDAIALWTAPQRMQGGQLDLGRQAIYATRGIDAYPGAIVFGQPEQVAPPAQNSGVTVIIDPASDRGLALWRDEAGAIEYAIRGESAR